MWITKTFNIDYRGIYIHYMTQRINAILDTTVNLIPTWLTMNFEIMSHIMIHGQCTTRDHMHQQLGYEVTVVSIMIMCDDAVLAQYVNVCISHVHTIQWNEQLSMLITTQKRSRKIQKFGRVTIMQSYNRGLEQKKGLAKFKNLVV